MCLHHQAAETFLLPPVEGSSEHTKGRDHYHRPWSISLRSPIGESHSPCRVKHHCISQNGKKNNNQTHAHSKSVISFQAGNLCIFIRKAPALLIPHDSICCLFYAVGNKLFHFNWENCSKNLFKCILGPPRVKPKEQQN